MRLHDGKRNRWIVMGWFLLCFGFIVQGQLFSSVYSSPSDTDSSFVVPNNREIYVSPNGVDVPQCGTLVRPCASLREAESISVAGDTIKVMRGTYQGSANFPLYIKNGVSLTSVSGLDATILNCRGVTSCIISQVTTINKVIKGFTFTTDKAAPLWGILVVTNNNTAIADYGDEINFRKYTGGLNHRMQKSSGASVMKKKPSENIHSRSFINLENIRDRRIFKSITHQTRSGSIGIDLEDCLFDNIFCSELSATAIIHSDVPITITHCTFRNLITFENSPVIWGQSALMIRESAFKSIVGVVGITLRDSGSGLFSLEHSNIESCWMRKTFLDLPVATYLERVNIQSSIGPFLTVSFNLPSSVGSIGLFNISARNVTVLDQSSFISFTSATTEVLDHLPATIADASFIDIESKTTVVYAKRTDVNIQNMECMGVKGSECLTVVNALAATVDRLTTGEGITITGSTTLGTTLGHSTIDFSSSTLGGTLNIKMLGAGGTVSLENCTLYASNSFDAVDVSSSASTVVQFGNCSFVSHNATDAVALGCTNSSASPQIEFSSSEPSTFVNTSITYPSEDKDDICTHIDCGNRNIACIKINPDPSSHHGNGTTGDHSHHHGHTTGFIVGTTVASCLGALILLGAVVAFFYHRRQAMRVDGFQPIAA